MNEGTTYLLIGLLELLFGFFFLVLSAALYFFDIFKFKLKGNRIIVVALLMLLGWLLFIYGGIQIFENYSSII
ncbi:hypothetical protein J7J90_02825 [Candidatus Micrarchaeota archaeon]|nr:hypothetical protein [Candidatus Micrarchaeota archaeon]